MGELLKKHEMTEEDVKMKLISPALEKSGWDVKKHIKFEFYFTDGRIIVNGENIKRGKRKRADYLLHYTKDFQIAIIEAKDNKHTIYDGMQQAIDYADILDVPFAYSSNGDGFIEHDRLTGQETELSIDEFPSPEELWERYKKAKNIDSDTESLIKEPYHFQPNDFSPRYYQTIAINRTIEAIAKGQQRILLVMATGTGKTFTAFQIIYKLWKLRRKKKILFLADRNVLIDQTMTQDFKPFNKVMKKVVKRELDSSYEVYMALYQQLTGDGQDDLFKQFTPEFFDLIIIDECHRGSANEESNWRRVLEYFHNATQIGLTATPKETTKTSNISYFGEAIYTYSLKQGISDGFLAPYKVHRISIDRDLEGWRPVQGQLDVDGNLVEDREYNTKDYDKTLIIDDRTELVAKRVSDHLKATDRFSKTIVFCVDINHASRMRQALINENSDLVRQDSRYIMQITGDNNEGKAQLENFTDVHSKYPVIVTTSKLLTTGVDCKTCKLIVLDNNINSITEFKQIIGRGTRLRIDKNKSYFTIMDFRNASRLFADPEFDGEPISIIEGDGDGPGTGGGRDGEGDGSGHVDPEPPEDFTPNTKVRVKGIDVSIINERIQYCGENGKLVTESITDYSKKNILDEYATLDEFLKVWNASLRKSAIKEEFEKQGILLEELRKVSNQYEIDDFDLICHLAYDKPVLTKAERANNVRKRGYLYKYSDLAQQILDDLLNKYMNEGIEEIENIRVLMNEPFRQYGDPMQIAEIFGGKEGYINAVHELGVAIYAS